MAKKSAKKAPATKPAKKAGVKKSGAKPVTYVRKSGTAKSPVKAAPARNMGKPAAKPVPKAELGGPFPVSTGAGANALEIANKLVAYFNQGAEKKVWDELWDFGIVSCEGFGAEMEWRGRPAVEGKNAAWSKEHTILGARAEGPFVGATGFSVRFEVEVEEKSTGNKVHMTEVGVYTVRNGRIVREEFMYGPRKVL